MSLFENAYSDQAANIGERLNQMNSNAGAIARARTSLAVQEESLKEKVGELPIQSDEGLGELGLSGVLGAFPSTAAISSAGGAYLKSGTQKLFKSAIQRAKAKKTLTEEDEGDIDPSAITSQEDADEAFQKLTGRLGKLSSEGQTAAREEYSQSEGTTGLNDPDNSVPQMQTNAGKYQDAIKNQEIKEPMTEEETEARFPSGSEANPALDDASEGIPRVPTNNAGEIIDQQGQVGTQGAEDGANFASKLAKFQGVDTTADDAVSQIGKLAGEDATDLGVDEITSAAGEILGESSSILGTIGGAVGTAMGFLGPLGALAGIGMGIYGAVKEAQAAAQEQKVDSMYAKATKQVSQLEATAGEAPSFSVGSMSMPVADSTTFRGGQAHF